MGSPSRRRHAAASTTIGEEGGKGKRGGAEGYFDVEGDVEDFLLSEDDFESDDFLELSFDDEDDESALASDFSDLPEESEESDESLPSDEPSEWERLTALRLSVRWKPEPLNTMPTGWRTLDSLPPHPGCFFNGSSEKDCHSSISSPHFPHS
jgi:hypothetical protein